MSFHNKEISKLLSNPVQAFSTIFSKTRDTFDHQFYYSIAIPFVTRLSIEQRAFLDERNDVFSCLCLGLHEISNILIDAGCSFKAGFNGFTALHVVYGCSRKTVADVADIQVELAIQQKLIDLGADVNAQTDLGTTPCMSMCVFSARDVPLASNRCKFLENFISAGANVNICDNSGATALTGIACSSPLLVRTLIAAGANVNHETGDKRRPLHFAADLNGNCDSIDLLLAAGADIDALSSKIKPSDIDSLLYQAKIDLQLSEIPSDIKAKLNSCAAITCAANFNNQKTLKALIAAGAHINLTRDGCHCTIMSNAKDSLWQEDCCLWYLLAASDENDADWDLFLHFLRRLHAMQLAPAAIRTNNLDSLLAELVSTFVDPMEKRMQFLDADTNLLDMAICEARLASLRAELSPLIFTKCRARLAEICIALQPLRLPALVSLFIVDAMHLRFWLVPMYKKWNVITTVKNFQK
jgi:ankyrin repeat protein